MGRPSSDVNIFSKAPTVNTVLPASILASGYQPNQVITAGEYNQVMSLMQKWTKYLDEQRASGATADTALEKRATSLEQSRTNRIGSIITTLSIFRPPDCLPCNGAVYRKADYQELINYALANRMFPINTIESNNLYNSNVWGKLLNHVHNVANPYFHTPKLYSMFLRMMGGYTGAPGHYQADDIKSHSHGIKADDGIFAAGADNIVGDGTGRVNSHPVQSLATGGIETRPKNIAVNYWIQYK